MGQQIDQFCEDLRLKLADIDDRFDRLKAKIDGSAHNADQAVRGHLAEVQKRIENDRDTVSAARDKVKTWVESRKIATAGKVAEWKASRELNRLQDRAEGAEAYADAAVDVALDAMDEAEQAALEAWLARREANFAQEQRAADLVR